MSTITVNLQEPEPVGGETGHSFVTTINEGISGFFGMIDLIIIILFTLLPLMILGAIGYGIYRWRKGKQPPRAPADLTDKKLSFLFFRCRSAPAVFSSVPSGSSCSVEILRTILTLL
jgi:hypothetical protein